MKRVKPGNGQALPPYRWWHPLNRALLFARVPSEGGSATYAVDVRVLGDTEDGEVRARLYRDGRQVAVSRVPARFPVENGVIEVRAGTYGLRRAEWVADDGTRTAMTPHPRSGEGLRARFHRAHPTASRAIAGASIVVVLVGVTLEVLQLLEILTGIPPVNEITGSFVSPVALPLWANVTVVLIVAVASIERALRLRSSWLDELAG